MSPERQPWWCFLCQQERSKCGGTDGSCPRVEAQAAEYRKDLAEGRVQTQFSGLRRLAAEREYGKSQAEIGKEIQVEAAAAGKEIVSAKSYGDVKPPKRAEMNLRDVI